MGSAAVAAGDRLGFASGAVLALVVVVVAASAVAAEQVVPAAVEVDQMHQSQTSYHCSFALLDYSKGMRSAVVGLVFLPFDSYSDPDQVLTTEPAPSVD